MRTSAGRGCKALRARCEAFGGKAGRREKLCDTGGGRDMERFDGRRACCGERKKGLRGNSDEGDASQMSTPLRRTQYEA